MKESTGERYTDDFLAKITCDSIVYGCIYLKVHIMLTLAWHREEGISGLLCIEAVLTIFRVQHNSSYDYMLGHYKVHVAVILYPGLYLRNIQALITRIDVGDQNHVVNSSFLPASKVFNHSINFSNVHGDSTLCFSTEMLFSPLSVFTAKDATKNAVFQSSLVHVSAYYCKTYTPSSHYNWRVKRESFLTKKLNARSSVYYLDM